jgi:hypothetical protein
MQFSYQHNNIVNSKIYKVLIINVNHFAGQGVG